MLSNVRYVETDIYVGPYGRAKRVKRIEGTCSCGRRILITHDEGDGFDCECGRIYNLSGQELRPRSEWEEPMDEDDY